MNIKGLMFLQENNFPIMMDTLFFRKLSEIPSEYLEKYGDDKKWAMQGFSNQTKITNHPYEINKSVVRGFPKEEIFEVFGKINNDMDKLEIPCDERIFLICRVFSNDNVKISGHIFKKKKD